jgi:hypothetical protein
MTARTRIAPQNSLLLVMDKNNGEIPESMNGKPVIATTSCIAVGTLSEADGETSVTITNEGSQPRGIPGLRRIFVGKIATPGQLVSVCTVLLQPVLELPVQNTRSDVEIWASSETEPNELCILIT